MKRIFWFIVVVFVFAFTPKKEEALPRYSQIHTTVYIREDVSDRVSPLTGNGFTAFADAIGFKESRNNYFRVNDRGYLGKYQFGASTLHVLGIRNEQSFLYHPEYQEKAFYTYCRYNKWLLKDEIKKYSGTYIKGIYITESGILAAAHLAGAGGVKRFLHHAGRSKTIIDAYGTTVEYYLKKFAGYDLSSLTPVQSPKVR